MTNDQKAGNDLQIRDNLAQEYSDVYTPDVIAALTLMAQFNAAQKQLMNERIRRRNDPTRCTAAAYYGVSMRLRAGAPAGMHRRDHCEAPAAMFERAAVIHSHYLQSWHAALHGPERDLMVAKQERAGLPTDVGRRLRMVEVTMADQHHRDVVQLGTAPRRCVTPGVDDDPESAKTFPIGPPGPKFQGCRTRSSGCGGRGYARSPIRVRCR